MRNKQTIFQQAQKQLKRIAKIARRIAMRGYEFDLPFGKTKDGKEKTRFTLKDLEELKNIKAKDLYQYATAFGMSGEEYRKLERKRAAKKGAITRKRNESYVPTEEGFGVWDTIINNFIYGDGWNIHFTDVGRQKLINWIEQKISIFGKRVVADVLNEAKADGTVLFIKQHSYDWKVLANLRELEAYFAGKYTIDEEREMARKMSKELQDETDDYDESYDDEELPFDF